MNRYAPADPAQGEPLVKDETVSLTTILSLQDQAESAVIDLERAWAMMLLGPAPAAGGIEPARPLAASGDRFTAAAAHMHDLIGRIRVVAREVAIRAGS